MTFVCGTPVYPVRYEYIAPNGLVYPFDVPGSRAVLSSEGEGMPPIDYRTQRGPFQHGNTVLDYFLQPRVVQLTIRQWDSYVPIIEQAREILVGTLNPGLQATAYALDEGTLRKQLSDGQFRAIDCFILQGPNFQPHSGGWDIASFTEVLRFQASNPTWYDPTVQTITFDPSTRSELVGPITGPIFSSDIAMASASTYAGTWLSYPTFTLTGPLTGLIITNSTTGDVIEITYLLEDGRTAVLDLSPGVKTFTLDDGTNLLGYITTESDLTAWSLNPINSGVNNISVVMTGTNSSSRVVMSYFDRYLGI